MQVTKSVALILCVVVFALLLAGVACTKSDTTQNGTGQGDTTQVASLIKLATALFNARNYQGMYSTYSPRYREEASYSEFEEYARTAVEMWLVMGGGKASVSNITVSIDGDWANASYTLMSDGQVVDRVTDDLYRKVNGRWYDVAEDWTQPGYNSEDLPTSDDDASTVDDDAIDISVPPPRADFTVEATQGELIIQDPIAGLAPLTLRFTDNSVGEITSRQWNFGDGSAIVHEESPAHTYAKFGRFTVQLSVEGPGGSDTEVKTFLVTILTVSEAANQELNQARQAILDCMEKAEVAQLDADVLAWDGSSGKVTAGDGTKDAADYLLRKPFRATYDVSPDGQIYNGDPGTWGTSIVWDTSTEPDRWRAVADV